MKNADIEINPNSEVLKWARVSAGFSIDEITDVLNGRWKNLPNGVLTDWEGGQTKPTFTQLMFLSGKYKIPFAAFFSQRVPKTKNVPPEFRTLAKNGQIKLTPRVLLAIRKARLLQQNVRNISEALDIDFKFKLPQYDRVKTTPKELAKAVRETFNYSISALEEIRKNSITPFNFLRDKIEEANCIVVKSTYTNSFSNEEARAFSLVDDSPFLINITNDDTETGKLFSLMHEFGHILLRESSIVAGNEVNLLSKNDNTERFCNAFASNFLVDRKELKHYYDVHNNQDVEITIQRLTNIFKVSFFVILIALNDIGVVDNKTCDKLFEEKARNYRRIKANGGAFYPERDIFNRLGTRVVSLFVQAERLEKISYTDVSDFLGVRPRYLTDIYSMSING